MKTDDLLSKMTWEQKMKLMNLGSLNKVLETKPADDEDTAPAVNLSDLLPKKVKPVAINYSQLLEPAKEPDYLKLLDLKPKPVPKPDRLLYSIDGFSHKGSIDCNHRVRDIFGRDTMHHVDVLDIVRDPMGNAVGQINCLGQIGPPPMIPAHMMPPPPIPQGPAGGY